MAKKTTILLLITTLFLSVVGISEAKVLPRFSKSTAVPATAVRNSNISIYPRLRGDRRALVVTFSNSSLANSVNFTLVYQTNGKDEGASGSVDVSQGTVTREVLFGTCSSGVCRYHPNISNARFEVVTELKNGKKSVKRYKIKV